MTEKLLLHSCCAVCFTGLIGEFRARGFEVTGYFYNPNIHPFMEFQKRLKAAELACEYSKAPFICDREYGLEMFLKLMDGDYHDRCGKCYRVRLEQAARKAAEGGFPSFSSTLIISPQQKQELIVSIGEEVGRKYGVKFVQFPATHLHDTGKAEAKRQSLYRQQYCGCIFSEHERYRRPDNDA